MAAPATPHGPPPAELDFNETVASMRAFALAGLQESTIGLGKLQGGPVARKQMLEAFGADDTTIASELAENKLRQALNNRFLPLPSVRTITTTKQAYFLSFFRPKFKMKGTPEECDFDLMLVCKDKINTLGFAIERSRRLHDTHGFTHVQLRKNFNDCSIEASLAVAFSQSYPAWPVRCRLFGDAWISVLVTLYGLSSQNDKGLAKIIDNVSIGKQLTNGSKILERARYLFDVPKT